MYVCMNVCVHVCVCMPMNKRMCVCIYVCVCRYVCVRERECGCLCVHTCLCVIVTTECSLCHAHENFTLLQRFSMRWSTSIGKFEKCVLRVRLLGAS